MIQIPGWNSARRREMMNTLLLLAIGVVIGAVIALLWVATMKPRYTQQVRKHAVEQSKAVTRGQIYEQLVPYLPGVRIQPKRRPIPRQAGRLRGVRRFGRGRSPANRIRRGKDGRCHAQYARTTRPRCDTQGTRRVARGDPRGVRPFGSRRVAIGDAHASDVRCPSNHDADHLEVFGLHARRAVIGAIVVGPECRQVALESFARGLVQRGERSQRRPVPESEQVHHFLRPERILERDQPARERQRRAASADSRPHRLFGAPLQRRRNSRLEAERSAPSP